MAQYSKEQLWELYKKLPEDLQEQLWSSETSDTILKMGEVNGLSDDQNKKLVKYVGFVFNGILPPDSFSEAIRKDLKLTKIVAEKLAGEIDRFVFRPVKNSLNDFYYPKAGQGVKEMPAQEGEVVAKKEESIATEEAKAEGEADRYREDII